MASRRRDAARRSRRAATGAGRAAGERYHLVTLTFTWMRHFLHIVIISVRVPRGARSRFDGDVHGNEPGGGPDRPGMAAVSDRLQPRPRKLALLRWLPSALVVSRARTYPPAVHLTFDDGPHPEHTPRVLDALARHGAQATFFLIGDMALRHPGLVRRIAAEGHGIGNHSHTHPEFRGLPLARQVEEIERADAALRGIVGDRPIPFRTPRGALPPRLVTHLAARGRPIVYWSYDTLDYRRPDPARLIAMLQARPPRAGDIVLMHDDGPAAPEILDAVLPRWLAAGLAVRGLPAGLGNA